ncbi:hypothetical protein A2U01_0088591, partial [Trifolium medium]|nr:hypothetical protein [Trifolium medium]
VEFITKVVRTGPAGRTGNRTCVRSGQGAEPPCMETGKTGAEPVKTRRSVQFGGLDFFFE